jgi:hypothetical protein
MTQTNQALLAIRPPTLPDVGRANGVVFDLRRAYVDRGAWEVEAPFGLAYMAATTQTTN